MLQMLRRSHDTAEPATAPADTMRAFLATLVPSSFVRARDRVAATRRELAAANEVETAAIHANINRPSGAPERAADIRKAQGAVADIEARLRPERAALANERKALAETVRVALAPRRLDIGERLAELADELAAVHAELRAVDAFASEHGLTEYLANDAHALPNAEALRLVARRFGVKV